MKKITIFLLLLILFSAPSFAATSTQFQFASDVITTAGIYWQGIGEIMTAKAAVERNDILKHTGKAIKKFSEAKKVIGRWNKDKDEKRSMIVESMYNGIDVYLVNARKYEKLWLKAKKGDSVDQFVLIDFVTKTEEEEDGAEKNIAFGIGSLDPKGFSGAENKLLLKKVDEYFKDTLKIHRKDPRKSGRIPWVIGDVQDILNGK